MSFCYDCRLFYIKQGNGRIYVEGKTYEFTENTVVFFPPGTGYRFLADTYDDNFIILVFDFDLVDNFSFLKQSLSTGTADTFQPEKIPAYPIPQEFSGILIKNSPLLYESLKTITFNF